MKNYLSLFATLLLFVVTTNNSYSLPKPPYQRHQIRLIDQANNTIAGIIDFDIYIGKKTTYANGGAFYTLPSYKGKTDVQKIFGDWLQKLPKLGVQKAYWRADPFKIDDKGSISYYHNDHIGYQKALAKNIPFYSAIGGKPETDATGAIICNGDSTSQGMKSVRFHYKVPGPIKPLPFSYAMQLKTLLGKKIIHTIYLK